MNILLVAFWFLVGSVCLAQDIILSRSVIDFGLVGSCQAAKDSLVLTNASNVVVPAPTISVRGGFRYYLSNDDTLDILPGESRTVVVEFIGDASRFEWMINTLYTFFPKNASQSLSVTPIVVRGRRLNDSCATLTLDDISAKAGTPVDLTLRQTGTQPNPAIVFDSVTVWLRWDSTCLVLSRQIPGALLQSVGTALVTVPLRTSDGVLLRIPATVTLGTSDTTPLSIVSYSSSIRLGSRSGVLSLQDVCYDERPRLFDPSAIVAQRNIVVFDISGSRIGEIPQSNGETEMNHLRRLGIRGAVFLYDIQMRIARLRIVE
jgi:hypothetical protein